MHKELQPAIARVCAACGTVRGMAATRTTAQVLEAAGVELSEAEFAELLANAIEALGPRMLRSARHLDPISALGPVDAAALAEGGVDLSPWPKGAGDPLAPALAASAGLVADALTVPEAAVALGVDVSRVRHRLGEGTLHGIRLRRGWRLPAWQFSPGGGPRGCGPLVTGLDVVLPHLPAGLHPVSLHRWATAAVPDLELSGQDLSPIEWLSSGGAPLRVAELLGGLDSGH